MRSIAWGAAASLALVATAVPAMAQDESQVSVLHAVPGLTVDVYVNGEETIPDFEPGTVTDPLTLSAGDYDIEVYAAGADPETEDPAISAEGLAVPGGATLTLTANLDADGNPALNAFVNDTSTLDAGQARLTVRHTAAAPAVDIRAGGSPVIDGLTNPNEEVLNLDAGTVSADVTLAGTEDVAIGPADLDLAEGTNTIVYAWGSAADGNLDLAVQVIDGLHGGPSGVPTGDGGLLEGGSLAWMWVLGAGGVAGVLVAGRKLSAQGQHAA